MRLLCTVLILACAATYAYAAVGRYREQTKPAEFANQEGCYLSSLNRVLPYDEPYYPEGECVQYTCEKKTKETQVVSCGVLYAPNCRIVKDLTKKYPACCDQPVDCDPITTTEPPNVEDTCDDNQ